MKVWVGTSRGYVITIEITAWIKTLKQLARERMATFVAGLPSLQHLKLCYLPFRRPHCNMLSPVL
jgi:hypothetical protein